MFGLSLSEIFIIALVALIVIGPERLPKTARALGLLMGRAQRYVNDIKGDIEREMHVDDIKKFKDEVASNVTKVKSSVEGEITSITNPIKNLGNPLEAVKSEVQDLEKQLKGSLNPLPDLEELKLDEVAKKAASVPLAEAPKVVASKTVSQSAAAVTAGVSPTTEAMAVSAIESPELVEVETKAQVKSQSLHDKAPVVAAATPEMSVVPSAAFEPTQVTKIETAKIKKLPDSTVAEAIIYPEENDARLASGTEVVKQRWSPPELGEDDSIQSSSTEVLSDKQGSDTTGQVASIYDGPSYEPLAEPERDLEELEARTEAWDSFVELYESPVSSDQSLEGLGLWEQMPEDKNQVTQKIAQTAVASTESEDKNNSSSDNGGSNV